ncbi:tetratricopeptide repeat-containing protein [Pseudomonas serbica]
MDCFVIRGFGKKKDSLGLEIDFDKVDAALITPALEKCELIGGTTVRVVDAGAVHKDMFQLILKADIVICDITVHNPNVFYELGARHALRKKHTVLIKGKPSGDATPFDITGARYTPYEVAEPGKALEDLVVAIKTSLARSRETDSPIFLMMPELPEADVDSVAMVPLTFVEEVQRAEARTDRGWLRLLAEDVRGELFQREGLKLIGWAQWMLKDYLAAVDTWEAVRHCAEQDLDANLALANLYERLFRQTEDPIQLQRSNQAIMRVLQRGSLSPAHKSEALALQGRNLKTLWRLNFEKLPTVLQRRERAINHKAIQAYEAYRAAHQVDLNNFFPGLAALQMGHILYSLSGEARFGNLFNDEKRARRFIEDLEGELTGLSQMVRVSIENALAAKEHKDHPWAQISSADLTFLEHVYDPPGADLSAVVDAYRNNVPENGAASNDQGQWKGSSAPRDNFFWDSARGQLMLFEQLGVGATAAHAVIEEFDGLVPPTDDANGSASQKKRHLVVFSGHNVDPVDPPPAVPRFPGSAQVRARELIEAALLKLKNQGDQLEVLVSAAPGADILALETCKALTIATWLCLPVQRDAVAREVFKDYDDWRNRFFALADAQPRDRIFVLSDNGGLPKWLGANTKMTVWSRGNRWMLCQAQAWGADRVTLLALWDHNKDDKSLNGTAGMLKLAQEAGGIYIELIDCRPLAKPDL